jgi:hypothetical protein
MKKNKKLVSLHNKAHYLGEKYFSESWAKQDLPRNPRREGQTHRLKEERKRTGATITGRRIRRKQLRPDS